MFGGEFGEKRSLTSIEYLACGCLVGALDMHGDERVLDEEVGIETIGGEGLHVVLGTHEHKAGDAARGAKKVKERGGWDGQQRRRGSGGGQRSAIQGGGSGYGPLKIAGASDQGWWQGWTREKGKGGEGKEGGGGGGDCLFFQKKKTYQLRG